MPAKIVGTGPNRSVSRPEIGDSANIPSVWAESTMPTAVRSWPCSVMCSGVIVMIRTITTCPMTSAMIAAATAGRRTMSRIGATLGPGSSRVASRDASSASWYGSGRRRAKDRIAARPTNTIGTR